MVNRNELHNAADAGALAGARHLYNADGTSVDPGCNAIAQTAATANMSENIAVEVVPNDVKRGHWSFVSQSFTANNSLAPVSLWNVTWEDLDADTNFINAVEVTARRETTQVAAWFSTILNYVGFKQSATAVAYIGFAGTLAPQDADQPIAICKQSIIINGNYSCNVGRMTNSGNNKQTSNTAGWTNFAQEPNCSTANPSNVSCGGNTSLLNFGLGIGATGGQQIPNFNTLEDCWVSFTNKNKTWELTLPVIDCPGNNVSNCAKLLGAVTVKIVWMTRNNDKYSDVPKSMTDTETGVTWPTSGDLNDSISTLANYFVPNPGNNFPSSLSGTLTDYFDVDIHGVCTADQSGMIRWASFVKHFQLKNVTDPSTGNAPYATFSTPSFYFIPSCTPHEPMGTSQGENFGILAQIPVLVH